MAPFHISMNATCMQSNERKVWDLFRFVLVAILSGQKKTGANSAREGWPKLYSFKKYSILLAAVAAAVAVTLSRKCFNCVAVICFFLVFSFPHGRIYFITQKVKPSKIKTPADWVDWNGAGGKKQ